MSTRKGGLGRGLDSLIPTSLSDPITSNTGVKIADQGQVDINSIIPNHRQPRTNFDTDALKRTFFINKGSGNFTTSRS